MHPRQPKRRAIPAVDKLLQALGNTGLPRPVVVAVVRRKLAGLRAAAGVPGFDTIAGDLRRALNSLRHSALQPVINGTGVLLHTNLGRAPLGERTLAALSAIAGNYNNLEIDLDSGERGGRGTYLEQLLAGLCGADAATVTNNCAAALVLMLRHFTAGERKEVLISRGELVQIGGGFRIPEMLESSGACLREVGTTNRTTLADYAGAIGWSTALILKVHRSNFFMDGFVESPPTEALADLAHGKRLRLVEDLGSGAVVDTAALGVGREPTPREVLRRGVDLVCFSGDKLLGGPQAGIIAGRAKLVAALKRAPLFRALRCDKLSFAALQATVEAYLEAESAGTKEQSNAAQAELRTQLPVLGMLALDPSSLRWRAERLQTTLQSHRLAVTIGRGQGRVGGGTLPRVVFDSVTLELVPTEIPVAEFAARLRRGTPPVIGYVSGGRLRIDLRTVFPRQDTELAGAICTAVAAPG